MKVFDLVKMANGMVIGTGAGAIAKEIVKKVTPEDVGKVTKVSMMWAGSAIAGVTGFAAAEHMNGQLEELVNDVKGIFKKKDVEVDEESVETE